MASAAALPPSATSRSRQLPGQSSGQRSWGRAGVWHFASQPSSRASSAVPRVPPPMPGPRARQEWRTALGGTPGPFGVLHGFESGSFAMLPVRGHRSAYTQARMMRSPRGIWESLRDPWSVLPWTLRSRPHPSSVHLPHGRPRDIVHIPSPNRHRMGRSLLAGMAVLPGSHLPVNVPCQRAAECRDGRLPGHPDSPSQGPRVGGRPLELADGRRPVTRRRSAPDDAGNLPGSHVHPRFRDVDSLGSLLISKPAGGKASLVRIAVRLLGPRMQHRQRQGGWHRTPSDSPDGSPPRASPKQWASSRSRRPRETDLGHKAARPLAPATLEARPSPGPRGRLASGPRRHA